MANWKELEKLFTTRLTMSQRPVAVTFLAKEPVGIERIAHRVFSWLHRET